MELIGTKHCFLLLALTPLVVSGAVPASAATSRHTHSSQSLYLYALPIVTVSAFGSGRQAHAKNTDSGWQPYAENTEGTPPFIPDRFGPLSKSEENNPQRAAAIHECNIRARRIGAERDWQAATYTLYGVCMSEQHQRFG